MSDIKDHMYVQAVRPFRGRNHRIIKPGQTELLHSTAARAAVFRGDAKYVNKAEGPAPEVGAVVPVKGGAFKYPLTGCDGRKFDSRSEVLNKARSKDLLVLLDILSPGHGFASNTKKSHLKQAMGEALDRHSL
jgi:hypothetical protein